MQQWLSVYILTLGLGDMKWTSMSQVREIPYITHSSLYTND